MAARSQQSDEEYEIQLFNFSVKELQTSQRDIIRHRVHEMVTSLVDCICSNPDLTLSAQQSAICRATIATVTSGLLHNHAAQLGRIDRRIAERFSIPAGSVLPEHALLAKYEASAAEEQQLADELAAVQQQFNQQAQFMTVMDAELQLHERLAETLAKEARIMERVEQSLQLSTTSTEEAKACVRHLAESGD